MKKDNDDEEDDLDKNYLEKFLEVDGEPNEFQ